MLRGHSSARRSRGLNCHLLSDILLPSSGQQQHGLSMLRAFSPGHPRGSTPTVDGAGGSSALQGAHSSNSGIISRRGVFVTSRMPSAFSATHLAPKRLMSTSTAGGKSQAGHDGAGAAPACGDSIAGAADTTMTAAGTAEQAQVAMEVGPEAVSAFYTPPQLAIMAVDWVHAATGMPYWMSIVAITLGIRTAILPIAILSARNSARMAAMKPEMDALQTAIQNDQQSSQPRKAQRYRQETKALFKKHGASLMMNAALPAVQVPMFIGLFIGIKRMPEVIPEFATGGALWFQDLGAPDPYVIFPVASGVMMLASAELGTERGAMGVSSVKMKAGMRTLALLAPLLTMQFPTGVVLYWMTSNFCSILQTLAFKTPSIKKYFNFPDPPPTKLDSNSEKELGWFDVLGGSNPVKAYRKMQEQREAPAWFGPEGEIISRAGTEANVARDGAPFHPPPPMTGPVGGKAKTPVAAVAGQPKSQQSKPRVVLSDVRPSVKGKRAPRGQGKRREKTQTM